MHNDLIMRNKTARIHGRRLFLGSDERYYKRKYERMRRNAFFSLAGMIFTMLLYFALLFNI